MNQSEGVTFIVNDLCSLFAAVSRILSRILQQLDSAAGIRAVSNLIHMKSVIIYQLKYIYI